MGALGKIEIEESIIGTILKYPDFIKDVMTVIPPDVFYIDIHQEILSPLLYSEGKDLSLDNISQSLKDTNYSIYLAGKEFLMN